MLQTHTHTPELRALQNKITSSAHQYEELATLVSQFSAYLSTQLEQLAQQRESYADQLWEELEFGSAQTEPTKPSSQILSDPMEIIKSVDLMDSATAKNLLKKTVMREESLVEDIRKALAKDQQELTPELRRHLREICEHAEGAIQEMNRRITEAL